MSLLNKIATVGKQGLAIVQKNSPTLLIAGGVGLIVIGAVEVGKGTLRLDEVLEEHKKETERLHEAIELAETGEIEYTQQEARRDTAIIYARTIGRMFKLYWKAILLIGAGIGCICWSHAIMSQRMMGVMAAFNAMVTKNQKLEEYRAEAAKRLGEDVDKQLWESLDGKKVIQEVDENGNVKSIDEIGKELKNDGKVIIETYYQGNGVQTLDEAIDDIRRASEMIKRTIAVKGYAVLNEFFSLIDHEEGPEGMVLGFYEPNAEYAMKRDLVPSINGLNFHSRDWATYEEEWDRYHRIKLRIFTDGIIYDQVPKMKSLKTSNVIYGGEFRGKRKFANDNKNKHTEAEWFQ